VALGEATLIVNSSQGGGSKDTWVVSDRNERDLSELGRGRATTEVQLVPSAPPDAGPSGSGQKAQQEQQQQHHEDHGPGQGLHGRGRTQSHSQGHVLSQEGPPC
jgi:hypothetical protein